MIAAAASLPQRLGRHSLGSPACEARRAGHLSVRALGPRALLLGNPSRVSLDDTPAHTNLCLPEDVNSRRRPSVLAQRACPCATLLSPSASLRPWPLAARVRWPKPAEEHVEVVRGDDPQEAAQAPAHGLEQA